MCGFIAVVRLQPDATIHEEYVRAGALKYLLHRGPDAVGYFANERIALGHCRLSIADPQQRSNQPFISASGRIAVVYNGEIYNTTELREMLLRAGASLRTTSDTELLVEALDRWGIESVARLDGMFAFVAIDLVSGTVWVARDRAGIKPLYYASDGKRLFFASTLAALINYPGFRKRVRPESISAVLAYRYVPCGSTLMENVFCVPAGGYMTCKGKHLSTVKYWVPTFKVRYNGDAHASVNEIRHRVLAAAKQTSIADVSVGMLLSGGVDSTALAMAMSRQQTSVKMAFTASFADDEYDETSRASQVATRADLQLITVPMDRDITWQDLTDLTSLKGNAVTIHNEMAMYRLCNVVRQHVKVIACGEGADEIFGGYPRMFRFPWEFARQQLAERLPARCRGWVRRWIGAPAWRAGKATDCLNAFLDVYEYFPLEERVALFHPNIRRQLAEDMQLRNSIRAEIQETRAESPEELIQVFFLKIHLPVLLDMVDGATMANSVEARVPYLTNWFLDYAFQEPLETRIRWRSPWHHLRAMGSQLHALSERDDITKWPLRRAFEQDLPSDVLHGRKLGFPVPLTRQVRALCWDEKNRLRFDGDLRLYEWLDAKAVRKWALKHQDLRSDAVARRMLGLMGIECFLEQFAS